MKLRKLGAAVLSMVLAAAMLTGCGGTKIDGTKTVLTVNDEKIPLGVAAFLAKYEQAEIYAMYGQYLGTSNIFGTVVDASTGQNYGDSMKDYVMNMLEELVIVKQHASDYNVTLTDEETASIEAAAQKYIDSNTQEVRDKIGASKDDVVSLLTMDTLKADMLDPMAADVDTDVTQEESQQTSVTYITFEVATEDDSSAATTDSDTSGTASTQTAAEKNADRQADAATILADIQASGDVANADMNSIASGVNSDYSATTGAFTTNDTTDTTLDASIVDAVSGLEDGTLVDHVVTNSAGTSMYIVRLDKNNDEDKTTEKKASILKTRKQENYDSLLETWKADATIKVDEDVWGAVKITDSDPVTVAQDSSTASTEASTATSTSASTASSASAASSTEAQASTAESTAS